MNVKVVNMIPQSQSNEINDDAETNVAVNPADPRIIGGTAFTNQFPKSSFSRAMAGTLGSKPGLFRRARLTTTRSSAERSLLW